MASLAALSPLNGAIADAQAQPKPAPVATSAPAAGASPNATPGATPTSGDVPAGPVADYLAANKDLETLLDRRAGLEASIASASAAEKSALDRLTAAEQRLAGAIEKRDQVTQQVNQRQAAIAQAQDQVPALQTRATQLGERTEAEDGWLYGTENTHPFSVRAYRATLDARQRLADDEAAAEGTVTQLQQQAESDNADLARADKEITTDEQQADGLAREVGIARSRALDANGSLQAVEKKGAELSASLKDQLEALRQSGHPVGSAVASSGPVPVPEPLAWPTTPPRFYVLPGGPSPAIVRLGPPLHLDPSQLTTYDIAKEDWVAPIHGIITTPYGDATPYQAAHWAVDIAGKLYQPVLAAADGTVEFSGFTAGDNRLASYGMAVILRHNPHVTTLYAHLDDRAFGVQVKQGEAVKKGQVIAYVGLSGYTTGPHLHFEVRVDNQPIDPLLIVKP